MRALLRGGPHDGAIVEVTMAANTIIVPWRVDAATHDYEYEYEGHGLT